MDTREELRRLRKDLQRLLRQVDVIEASIPPPPGADGEEKKPRKLTERQQRAQHLELGIWRKPESLRKTAKRKTSKQ